jgi:hypothetical protein
VTSKRRNASEAEKATTPASERFMSQPDLMAMLAKTVTTYMKHFPFDALYGLHAVRDTVQVLIAKRTDDLIAERKSEIERLRAELAEKEGKN